MVVEDPVGVAVFVDQVQDFKHPVVARTREAADQDVSVLCEEKSKIVSSPDSNKSLYPRWAKLS